MSRDPSLTDVMMNTAERGHRRAARARCARPGAASRRCRSCARTARISSPCSIIGLWIAIARRAVHADARFVSYFSQSGAGARLALVERRIRGILRGLCAGRRGAAQPAAAASFWQLFFALRAAARSSRASCSAISGSSSTKCAGFVAGAAGDLADDARAREQSGVSTAHCCGRRRHSCSSRSRRSISPARRGFRMAHAAAAHRRDSAPASPGCWRSASSIPAPCGCCARRACRCARRVRHADHGAAHRSGPGLGARTAVGAAVRRRCVVLIAARARVDRAIGSASPRAGRVPSD